MTKQPDKQPSNTTPRQLLSRCHDGDLDSRECAWLLDALARDNALRAAWERYQLIGQAIRGDTVLPAARGLADDVRRALAETPAPSRLSYIRHFAARAGARAGTRRVGWATGLALAAGVTAVAVLILPAFDATPGSQPQTLTAQQGVAPSSESSVDTAGVSAFAPIQAQVWSRRSQDGQWQPQREAVAVRLDRLLITHQAAAPQAGPRGMLSHATLAGEQSSH